MGFVSFIALLPGVLIACGDSSPRDHGSTWHRKE
jgi:hypothetical protein